MFDAYKVAVKLSLVNNVSTGLAAITSQLGSVNKGFISAQGNAALLEKRLMNIKQLALVGGGMAALGFGGLALLKAPIEAARQYELAFTKFKTMNLGESVNRQADQFARSANVLGVSAKELMSTMAESVGLFGSFDVAKRLSPQLALLNKANSSIFGGKLDHLDEGSTRALMKFIDRRGGTHDEATFMRNLNLAQRMVTGSGGFVKFRDLDQFSQQGGTAFRGLSDDGILNMSLLLQEQGGARAGTAMMSMYQNLIAGRGTKTSQAVAASLGLGKIVQTSIGSVGGKKQTRNHLELNSDFASLLQSDPASALRQFVIPAIQKKYGADVSDNTIIKVVNDMLSNRTASGQASIMTTQVLQLMRDSNLARNAMGVDQTINAYKNDPNSKFAELQARYNGLMVELGISILPSAIKGLTSLIDLVKAMTSFTQSYPGLTRALAVGFIGLSAAMAFSGSVLLLTAGFRGLALATSIPGLAGVSGGFAAIGRALLFPGVGAGGAAGLATLAGSLGGVAAGMLVLYGATQALFSALDWLLPNKVDPKTGRKRAGRSSFVVPGWDENKAKESATDPHAGEHFVRSGRGGYWVKNDASVAPSSAIKAPTTINNTIVMPDGQVLARVVTKEQVKAGARPPTGPNSFDGSMNPRTVGGR